MGLWLKQGDDLVPVGGGGGGSFEGDHVLTGDPLDPPAELQVGQLLYDGDPSTGGGSGDGGPHDHDEYAAVEHDHDEFTHDHAYLPLTGGTVTGDLRVDGQIKTTVGGSKDAPAFQIGTDKALGMFGSINSQWLRFVSDGDVRLQVGTLKTTAYQDLQVDGQTLAQNGTRAKPAYSFASDPDTGIHTGMEGGTDGIEIVGNGKRLLQLGLSDPTRGAWMPPISTRTTTIPANVYIHTDAAQEGALFRSTASRAFMQEVEAVNFDATNSVYDLSPIWFRSTCDGDNIKHSHYGLAAEDVAAVDPRLAIMATDEDGVETADNVNMNAVIALLVSAVKTQRDTIADLSATVADQTEKIAALEAN